MEVADSDKSNFSLFFRYLFILTGLLLFHFINSIFCDTLKIQN